MKLLLLSLLSLPALSQTIEPIAGTVTIPAGTFETPITFSSPLSRTGNTVTCPGCGTGGSGSISAPLQTPINLYVSTTGNDAAPCSSAAPCKTLAHALAQIPALLTQPYQVNVADGTYAEPIDGRGYAGASITVIGNVANPANVVFTGSLSGCEAPRFSTFTTGVCLRGDSADWTLSGISINASARNGVTCDHCAAILSDINVGGATVCGILNESGYLTLHGAIGISGFGGGDVTNSSFGIDNIIAGRIFQSAGTLTITGPGWANGLISQGIVEEFQSMWTLLPQCDTCSRSINIVISNVLNGIQVTSHSSFVSFVSTGTITLDNPTNSGGHGIDMYNASEFDLVGGATGINLTINNFGYCTSQYEISVLSHGPGNRTFTNCGGSNVQQGSVAILF
jgi:hypothetical protein